MKFLRDFFFGTPNIREDHHEHRYVPIRHGYPQRICKCGAMKIGKNTITLSPGGADVLRWSTTQAATAAGDIGMNVTTGRPSAFVGGVNSPFALSADIISQIVEATDTSALNTTTLTLLPSMTITPASGTYTAWFSGTFEDVLGGGTDVIEAQIFVDGVAVAASMKRASLSVINEMTNISITTMARVVVDGTDAIEVRARRATGDGAPSVRERQLMIAVSG